MIELELKQAIRQVMLYHQGRQNAINRRDLCKALELPFNSTSDRRIRELITELRRGDSLNEPFPILPCNDGYYLPATEKEKQAGVDKYQSYIKDACITLRALKKGGTRYVAGDSQVRLI